MEVGVRAASRLRSSRLIPVLVLAGWLGCVAPALAAKLVSASGSGAEGYGRIQLTFDTPVTVSAKRSGAVLVVNFGRPVDPGPERIAAGMPDYVSTVRRDPDGSGLRIALQATYRINVQEAGEKVFVDLLPETWTGLPPALPAEVVAELARRAREAEALLKARNPDPVPVTLPLELSHTGDRVRLTLKHPPELKPEIVQEGAVTRLTLPGAWRIDAQATRGRLRADLGQLRVENGREAARLVVSAAEGVPVHAEDDGDELIVDFIVKPKRETGKQQAADQVRQPGFRSIGEIIAQFEPQAAIPTLPAATAAPTPTFALPLPNLPASDVPALTEPAQARASGSARRAGSGLVFPFKSAVSAALFERAGILTLVFEGGGAIAVPPPGETGLVALAAPRRIGNFTVLRFTAPTDKLVDLVPVSEPSGWELKAGDDLAPSESLVAQRVPGEAGRVGIAVRLPNPAGAVWLDSDGDRIAVVTATAAVHAGIAKPQRFVDFELLPSRLGLAVLAHADDLVVRPDIERVTIGREGGLAVSSIARPPEPATRPTGDLAIDRDEWENLRRGDVRLTIQNLHVAAADAARSQRGAARIALAKAQMANGLDPEAGGAFAAAVADDPAFGSDVQIALLRGILEARQGHADTAEKLLATERLARNPEARLWRGYAHATAGRWKLADENLRAAEAVLGSYPDDVASLIRVTAAESAIELADWDAAMASAKAASASPNPLVRDRLALLRARIDQAKGGIDAALDAYATLAEGAEWPVAAAARLRETLLLLDSGKLSAAEAIDRLETLKITWHGGQTEIELLATLGALYEQTGAVQKVFLMARRADLLAPDAPSTRRLHESAQALFEDLYLGEKADKLDGLQALALYFDYKDFAPAGRRADEIVRRLADRLVGLDLLDSADGLLQHQIDNRLIGPARASVAARLASIRLMDGKPLEALQVLDSTHLPELLPELRRARTLLRARALSDLTRTDLALETIEDESGSDVDRLRADILWGARRWREAGEAHEAMLGDAWRTRKALDDTARSDVVRAAIAYGLAGESIGLERLKAKFAPAMSQSSDARTFTLLTRGDAVRTSEFREIARKATSAETLAAFLAEYRKRYPKDAVPERGKREGAEQDDRSADAQAAAPSPG